MDDDVVEYLTSWNAMPTKSFDFPEKRDNTIKDVTMDLTLHA